MNQDGGLESRIGTRVTLTGIAGNAKGGAVLLTGDRGSVIYIDGLAEWPEELNRQAVEATGLLTREKYIPDPVVDAGDGAISQGAEGEQLVLKNAEWKDPSG